MVLVCIILGDILIGICIWYYYIRYIPCIPDKGCLEPTLNWGMYICNQLREENPAVYEEAKKLNTCDIVEFKRNICYLGIGIGVVLNIIGLLSISKIDKK